MDPVTNNILQGRPYAGMGTNLERLGLQKVLKSIIEQGQYTVKFIIDYAVGLGYQKQMAKDVFEELTGLNPDLIVLNNEYYKNPAFVPSFTIAWGYSKNKKNEAHYIVPFEYGFGIMKKNEIDVPEPVQEFATVNEAVDFLKGKVTKVFTIDQIITEDLLESDKIQLNAISLHDVDNPCFSDPVRELKNKYKKKLITLQQAHDEMFRLAASQKITAEESKSLTDWYQKVKEEQEMNDEEEIEFTKFREDNVENLTEEMHYLKGGEDSEFGYHRPYVLFAKEQDGQWVAYSGWDFPNITEQDRKDFENIGYSDVYVHEVSNESLEEVERRLNQETNDASKITAATEDVTLEDIDEKIMPGEIYEVAKSKLPSEDIDHHNSDLYIKVTPESKKLIEKLEYKNSGMLTTFKDDEGITWYELPFCYPMGKKSSKKVTAENIEDDKTTYVDSDLVQYHIEKFPSGKWYYWFNSPFSKRREQVGPYSTEQEAREFLKKHHDVDSNDVNENAFQDFFNWDSKKFSSYKIKAATEDVTLEDIKEEEQKSLIDEATENALDENMEDVLNDQTPQDFFEEEIKENVTTKMSQKVSEIIESFVTRFDTFENYDIYLNSYKVKTIEKGQDQEEDIVNDVEIDCEAILQVIININPVEDMSNIKKVLAVFSIDGNKVYWNGTVKAENNYFYAFAEEGLDALFKETEQKEEIIEDIV